MRDDGSLILELELKGNLEVMWKTSESQSRASCLCKCSSWERMFKQKGSCSKGAFSTEEVASWETPCFPASAHIFSNTGSVEVAGKLWGVNHVRHFLGQRHGLLTTATIYCLQALDITSYLILYSGSWEVRWTIMISISQIRNIGLTFCLRSLRESLDQI